MTVAGQIRTTGSALIVVLWSVVVLSTMVYSSLRVTRLDLRVAKNFGDRVQARYLALAGIEKAKAVIYDVRHGGATSSDLYDQDLYDNPTEFKEITLGRGTFSVFRGRLASESGSEPLVYGMLDEERFLDVNRASLEELRKLPDMDPEIAAAIVDWRDSDSKVSDGGAEEEYYGELHPPRFIRNGPFETQREMLLVKDMPLQRLFGEDTNANGILDPNERDGDRSLPNDNSDSRLERGWAHYLAIESGVEDLDARGEPRIDLSIAEVDDLQAIDGIDAALAEGIVAWRDHRSLQSLADLLDVEELVENESNNNGNTNNNGNNSGNANNNGTNSSGDRNANSNGSNDNGNMQNTGVKLIDTDTLASIADHLTVGSHLLRENVVNINTCNAEVLLCLPGMTEDLVAAIIDHRTAVRQFKSVAGLLEVEGVTKEVFKNMAARIDVRSGTFRILCEGVIPSTKARQRILVTVRIGEFEVETLSYREDL